MSFDASFFHLAAGVLGAIGAVTLARAVFETVRRQNTLKERILKGILLTGMGILCLRGAWFLHEFNSHASPVSKGPFVIFESPLGGRVFLLEVMEKNNGIWENRISLDHIDARHKIGKYLGEKRDSIIEASVWERDKDGAPMSLLVRLKEYQPEQPPE